MMHRNRVFVVSDVATPEDLAEKLTQHSWCLCTGFRHGGHLWLNDATSADGAFEVAVIREADMVQVESITFGWMKTSAEGLRYILGVLGGSTCEWFGAISNRIETIAEHGRCRYCA